MSEIKESRFIRSPEFKAFHLDIVSAEEAIFSGFALQLFVTGILGAMEILIGHAPLLTQLLAAPFWFIKPTGEKKVLYVSGGMLEVQPTHVTILADTVIRAEDLDEARALEAKKMAIEAIEKHDRTINYAQVHAQLSEAIAQLRTLKKLRDKSNY